MESVFTVAEADGAWEVRDPECEPRERHATVDEARAAALRLASLQRPSRVVIQREGEEDFVVFLRSFGPPAPPREATG